MNEITSRDAGDFVELDMRTANEWHQMRNGVLIHRRALIGMQPMQSATFARKTRTDYPPARFGYNVQVGPLALVYAGVIIGDDTVIGPAARIREDTVIGKRCTIGAGVQLGYGVVIGDDCQVMDDAHLSGGTIVGDNTFISVNVLALNDDKPKGYVWRGGTPVRIGSDVVVGGGARLRPGIVIGNGAVIAMGAIVTKDVPPEVIVKGQPARISAPTSAA